jgi:hypothetical protein
MEWLGRQQNKDNEELYVVLNVNNRRKLASSGSYIYSGTPNDISTSQTLTLVKVRILMKVMFIRGTRYVIHVNARVVSRLLS